MSAKLETSQPIAPEDIRSGDFVSVLHVICEFLSVSPCDGIPAWQEIEVRRVHLMPWKTEAPMKVVEVCLPYVLVQQPDGSHRTLDVRRARLARVSQRFGRRTFKRLRKPRPSRASATSEDG